MKTRLILLLAGLLLAATAAHATIVQDGVGFRVAQEPGPAALGKPFELQIEIVAESPVNIYDVRVLGTYWDDVTYTQPDMTWLDEGETARFKVGGIPRSVDATLEIVLGTDRGDLQRSVTVREWLPDKRRYRYELESLPPELEAKVLTGTADTRFPTETTPPPLLAGVVDHPLYGQDETDTDDPPIHDKSSWDVRVEGRVLYVRNDGALVGPLGATARLYDRDSTWDEHLATTHVDEYGYYRFDITWDPCAVCDGKPDFYVSIESNTDHVRVQESGWLEREYFWVTPTRDDVTDTYVYMGKKYINHDAWGVAADILTTLERGYQWLDEEPGIGVQKIHVQWPSDECSGASACYKPSTEEIHISHDRDWNRGTYIHEWGHHIMENWGSDASPDYCNDGDFCDEPGNCGHCQECAENPSVAVTEGFPNWMADRVLRYWEEQWWPHAPVNTRSQETLLECKDVPEGEPYIWADPESTERFFGALLRDIEDQNMDHHDNYPNNGDARDRLRLGAVPVMKVVLGYDDDFQVFPDASTPSHFLQLFLERYPDTDLPAFWSTARNCGFELDHTAPPNPTNLHSTSHFEGVASSNAYVRINWDKPTDDLSGLKGYSIRLSVNEPQAPDQTLDIYHHVEEINEGPFFPGTFYFTIRAVDYAGNWSGSYVTYGPIVIREPTPVDLAYDTPMGWDYPLVPRADDSATTLDVSLPPTLPGDSQQTWWNYSGINVGEADAPSDFTVGIYVDGKLVHSQVQSGEIGFAPYNYLNSGPSSVTGGRHTVEVRHDADGDVMEPDELNNSWARQFVWMPAWLPPNVIQHKTGGLADPEAGHDRIPDGVPVFDNVRGHGFSNDGGWNAVVMTTPYYQDDYDLALYNPSTGPEDGFTNPLALSHRGPGEAEFVFVNGNTMGVGNWNLGVKPATGYFPAAYDIQFVTGAPLPVGGARTIDFGENDHLDLSEVLFTSTTGPVTVTLSMDPAAWDGIVQIGWFHPLAQYGGGLNTINDLHQLDESGLVEFELSSMPEGECCFAVFRDPGDTSGPLTLQLSIVPQQPNLVPLTMTDWDGPIVPTSTALAGGPAVLPSFLVGDATATWFNWALMNASYNGTATGDGFQVRVNLDGQLRQSWIVPDVYGGFAAWEFGTAPHAVNAGRHSLTFHLDTLEDVPEYDENDNATGTQFVWRPVQMRKNDTAVRSRPPEMTGGWDGLTPGTFYFNCDGVRTPVFDPSRDGTYAAVAILPEADSDYDLRLHIPSSGPTHGFASSYATSSWGPGQSDYVLVDFTGARAFQFDAGVTKTSGTDDYTIQNATSTFLTFQQGQSRYGPFTLAQGEILALHEVDMPHGGYYVTAEIGRYPADLGISFHTAGVDFQAKADAQVGAWFAEPDQNEQIYVNEYDTDSQCLVVWKRNAGADIPVVEYYLVFGLAPSDSPGLSRDRFALHAAVPNPFNPQTRIAFDLPVSGEVRLAVYDVGGRLVRRLVDGEVRSAGRHEEVWDGRDAGGRTVAAGTYFYRMEAGGFTDTRSMTLVK